MLIKPFVISRIATIGLICTLVACTPPSIDSSAMAFGGCCGGHPMSGSHRMMPGARTMSSAGLPEGRIAMGEQLAKRPGSVLPQSCIECHGADGNNPLAPIYPRIGGQYPDYLAYALLAYRGKTRTHPMMTAQASQLSDQDIADLAAYFASRPSQLRDLTALQ